MDELIVPQRHDVGARKLGFSHRLCLRAGLEPTHRRLHRTGAFLELDVGDRVDHERQDARAVSGGRRVSTIQLRDGRGQTAMYRLRKM